jgi:hypothetical protein
MSGWQAGQTEGDGRVRDRHEGHSGRARFRVEFVMLH